MSLKGLTTIISIQPKLAILLLDDDNKKIIISSNVLINFSTNKQWEQVFVIKNFYLAQNRGDATPV